MKKYILMLASSLMLVSCVDTIILPDDKTVDEDFWQTKEQVSSMVNGAYAAMTSSDYMARIYVWGGFRGDEFLRSSEVTDNNNAVVLALDEIAAANMQTTNMFALWASFYDVINRCNIVLSRAAEVMEIDPNYTQGDYEVDRSQMLALRALCYFYLVRNFRDVPYTTTAYMNTSQERQLPQSAPAYVLEQCIKDLEEASQNALSSSGFSLSDWRRVGWITSDAINSILADIYLWRASITHSMSDYARCVEYCDKVIASKKAQHIPGRNEVVEKEYPLADAEQMFDKLFIEQNAEESIFELQGRNNLTLYNYYYKYKSANANGGTGYLKATPIFGSPTSSKLTASTAISNANLFYNGDLRYYGACYLPGSGEESYHIRKIISETAVTGKNALKARETLSSTTDRNYIFYRLTDVMLMKAEALVQQVDTTQESTVQADQMRIPFNLVQAVNTRALSQENVADSMTWSVFRSLNREQFELLVLQERMREFCFEGRRWYDLLRYNYRRMTGVDYSRTMADIVDGGGILPANNRDALSLMTRQRGTEQSGVMAKMVNEAFLYMPIPNSDIIVCPLLRQNPVYSNSNEYEKSY